jgi:hypothetical protein
LKIVIEFTAFLQFIEAVIIFFDCSEGLTDLSHRRFILNDKNEKSLSKRTLFYLNSLKQLPMKISPRDIFDQRRRKGKILIFKNNFLIKNIFLFEYSVKIITEK